MMKPRSLDQLVTSRTVGSNVLRIRKARGWPRSVLEARTEAAGHRLNNWVIKIIENGHHAYDRPKSVTVDELMALAGALGVSPEKLLTPPACGVCLDAPAAGFTCNACAAGGN